MSNGEIPRSLSARGGWLDDRLHAAQSLNRFMIILGGAAIWPRFEAWATGLGQPRVRGHGPAPARRRTQRRRAQRGRAQWRRAPGSGA
jgi:hypothetical protein